MRCFASVAYAVMQFLCVCLSVCHIRTFCQNEQISSGFFYHRVTTPFYFFPHQMGWRYSGIKCRWGRQKWQFQAYTWSGSLPAINAATGQVLSTRPAVDHGDRPASYDTYIAGLYNARMWVLDHQAPRAITHSVRPTKRGLALYTITVDHKSCVWQQGSMLRRRQRCRIELYALVNLKSK